MASSDWEILSYYSNDIVTLCYLFQGIICLFINLSTVNTITQIVFLVVYQTNNDPFTSSIKDYIYV